MLESRILDLLNPIAKGMDLNIIVVSLDSSKHIEIMIEKLDGESVDVSDCENFSRNASLVLDVNEVFKEKFLLSVSSCGVERPLINIADFVRFIGKTIDIHLKNLSENKANNKKSLKLKGVIKDVINSNDLNNAKICISNDENEILISFEDIKKSNLTYDENAFRDSLRKKAKAKNE